MNHAVFALRLIHFSTGHKFRLQGLIAYSAKPTFSSQSLICCIGGPPADLMLSALDRQGKPITCPNVVVRVLIWLTRLLVHAGPSINPSQIVDGS